MSLSRLYLNTHRSFSSTTRLAIVPQLSKATRTPTTHSKTTSKGSDLTRSPFAADFTGAKPAQLRKTPAQAAAAAAERAKAAIKKQQDNMEKLAGRQGKLADNSLFAEDELPPSEISEGAPTDAKAEQPKDSHSLAQRSFSNMARALDPRPNARLRWQRKMVIRQVRRGGRLTKEMKIARTERSHLAKSHFFKTSMKKLAPLARQIAGKSLDEAILQMRFSSKKVARDVRQHLIQARNEAIVLRGMGLRPQTSNIEEGTATTQIAADPAIEPPTASEYATKAKRPGVGSHETDMYIAQAWVNRGPYGKEMEPRARGRVNILRPPHTGISILLKEEKTRTREKMEKEAKEIRKRLGKNMWTQLPDRPVTRQSQYVLW